MIERGQDPRPPSAFLHRWRRESEGRSLKVRAAGRIGQQRAAAPQRRRREDEQV